MILGVRKNWLTYLFALVTNISYDLPFLSERACPESAISARPGDGDLHRETEEGGGAPPRTATGTGSNSGSHCYCQDTDQHRYIRLHLESMHEP